MGKMKVGIIGTGGISHLHARSYLNNPHVELVAACDIRPGRVEKFSEDYGIPHAFVHHRDLLALDLDAVSVCTWNDSHAEISIDALKAKKHVLCEKPLAMSHGQAVMMQEAQQASGKLLMVGFVRRFGRNTTLVKDLIDKGVLGEIYYARTSCLRRCGNPTGWFSDKGKSGGGPLIDLGVHMIDLCRYLMGKPMALRVTGVAFDNLGPRSDVKLLDRYTPMDKGGLSDVEDFAGAMIRFENGSVLHVEVSFTLHIKNDQTTCELFGTKAGAMVEPELEVISSLEGYNVDITPRYTKEKDVFAGNFQREIDHFTDCIINRTPCISPVEDGVELMRILDAIYESAKTQREVFLG
ncbi:MAG: Gfo/Idh/MocA family oxidoreductase [Clostridia bacterium]